LAPVIGAGLACVPRPPLPVSLGSTGIMWEGHHVSDIAAVPVENPLLAALLGESTLTARGFRAELLRHTVSTAERSVLGQLMFGRGGWQATASLNRGVPGSYANDVFFPYFSGATAVTQPRTLEEAQAFASWLEEHAPGYAEKTYRFSTPPRDNPAFDRAFGAGKSADPSFCPPGASNCINLALAEHEQALGGPNLVIERDGHLIDVATGKDLTTGQQVLEPAAAANMEEYLAQPEAFFAARGLTRTPIAGAMRLRLAAGVIKVGGSVLLVYGAVETASRLAEASPEELPVAAGEEAGSWAGGFIGSVLADALGGAFVCAETGPGAFLCALAFGVGGGVLGGSAGQSLGHEMGEGLCNLGKLTLPQAIESWTMMFGTDEQKRAYRELREIEGGGEPNDWDLP
jgi:hypothetical protein